MLLAVLVAWTIVGSMVVLTVIEPFSERIAAQERYELYDADRDWPSYFADNERAVQATYMFGADLDLYRSLRAEYDDDYAAIEMEIGRRFLVPELDADSNEFQDLLLAHFRADSDGILARYGSDFDRSLGFVGDPRLERKLAVHAIGYVWLPVAVALLIAGVALWRSRQ